MAAPTKGGGAGGLVARRHTLLTRAGKPWAVVRVDPLLLDARIDFPDPKGVETIKTGPTSSVTNPSVWTLWVEAAMGLKRGTYDLRFAKWSGKKIAVSKLTLRNRTDSVEQNILFPPSDSQRPAASTIELRTEAHELVGTLTLHAGGGGFSVLDAAGVRRIEVKPVDDSEENARTKIGLKFSAQDLGPTIAIFDGDAPAGSVEEAIGP